MPVVGVLLWATLLTLGWRAAHPKDHGFATPRVQLSFKGKSLVVGVVGRVGPQEGGNHEHPQYRLLLLARGASAICTLRNLHGDPCPGVAELPVCSSTHRTEGLVACLVPSSRMLRWVGGSLHLAKLGAEVWEAPPAAPRFQTAA